MANVRCHVPSMLLLFLAMLLPMQAASAGSRQVTLGETVVAIPVPNGFVEPQGAIGTQVTALFAEAAGTVSTNIVVFMARSDESAALAGRRARMDRYFVFGAPRSLASRTLSSEEFAATRGFVATQAQSLADDAGPSVQAGLDSATRLMKDKTGQSDQLKAGYMKELGVVYNRVDSICTLSVTPLTTISGSGQQTSLVAIAAVLALVRQKVVTFNIYSTYRSPADTKWVKQQCETWSQKLQQANPSTSTSSTSPRSRCSTRRLPRRRWLSTT